MVIQNKAVWFGFQFECCGVDNQTDWYYISAWPDRQNVPASCCVLPTEGCGEAGSGSPLYTKVITDE